MDNVRINRIATNPKHGSFGALTFNSQPICVSLEPYMRENERSISSIPAGQYIAERVVSPKYGDVFEVKNIQNLDKVLFHWGNRDRDTRGCILLGESFGVYKNDWAVLSSKVAFNEFMGLLEGKKEFQLTITETY